MSGKDLKGQIFGRLTVIKDTGKRKGECKVWLCKCECGNYIETRTSSLTNGDTKSCGCYQKDIVRKMQHEKFFKHGKCNTRLYKIWVTMKQRCNNPNAEHYDCYGGKGILVCEEWKNEFTIFENWALENGYKENLTIDRINGNGNYEPNNCRWSTRKEQSSNLRTNINITIHGETKTLSEWAIQYGFKQSTIWYRYSRGDRGDRLFRPVNNANNWRLKDVL